MVIVKLFKSQNHRTVLAVPSFPMSFYYTEPVHDIVVQHSRLVEGFSRSGVSMSPLSNRKRPVESFFSTLTAFSMGGNFFHFGSPEEKMVKNHLKTNETPKNELHVELNILRLIESWPSTHKPYSRAARD